MFVFHQRWKLFHQQLPDLNVQNHQAVVAVLNQNARPTVSSNMENSLLAESVRLMVWEVRIAFANGIAIEGHYLVHSQLKKS